MGWNPFRRTAPTPFLDLVTKASQEKVNEHLEEGSDEPETLAKVICQLDFMAAKTFMGSVRDHRIEGGHLDVLTFEAVAFSAWAISQHYLPLPHSTDPDYDSLVYKYDRDYDAEINDAFVFGSEVCVLLAERVTGWSDLKEVWNRRYMRYGMAKTYEEAVDIFITNAMICRASKHPMVAYFDVPKIEPLSDARLGMSAMAFANTIPPGYAETLHRIVGEYDFGEN